MDLLFDYPISWSESHLQTLFWVAGLGILLVIMVALFLTALRLMAQLTSEREKLEDVKQEAKRLNQAISGSSEGIWDWDISNKKLYCSQRLMEILGFESDDSITEVDDDFLTLRVHPDDELQTNEIIRSHIYRQIPLNFEARIRNREGVYIWVHIRGSSTQKDESTNILRSCGVMADVNEIKQQDIANKLSAVAFESSEGIVVIDHQYFIVKTNAAFSEISGFTEQDVLAKTPDVFRADSVSETQFQDFWKEAKKHGHSELKTWFKGLSGHQFPVLARLNRVHDDQGNITHMVLFFQNISEQLQYESQIKRMAFYDELTQLPNRRLFLDRLERALSRVERTKHIGAIIYIDLDHFKEINDTWGHKNGDDFLIEVSRRMASQVRNEDTLARIGGDEFVILMAEISTEVEMATSVLEHFCERLLAELIKPIHLVETELTASASLGVAMFPADAHSLDELLVQADTAMYKSKENGKGTWNFYSKEMQQNSKQRQLLQIDLNIALQAQQFCIYMQPQLQCIDNDVVNFELLLRWKHPTLGLLMPDYFIEQAEFSGQIVQLDQFVLLKALETLAELHQRKENGQLTEIPRLSINISQKYFQKVDFVQSMLSAIQPYRHVVHYLSIELTENTIFANLDDSLQKMQRLRSIGLKFIIDNFGTGHATLASLAKLPVVQLKIAKQLLQENRTHEINDISNALAQSRALLHSIILLARNLGLSVSAEGVENQHELDYLIAQQCHFYQGYINGQPLALAKLNDYLEFSEPETHPLTNHLSQ
jgi:diguanylate cyclase (GGDEF)-like protein/PAS domain S-box-containing protein